MLSPVFNCKESRGVFLSAVVSLFFALYSFFHTYSIDWKCKSYVLVQQACTRRLSRVTSTSVFWFVLPACIVPVLAFAKCQKSVGAPPIYLSDSFFIFYIKYQTLSESDHIASEWDRLSSLASSSTNL